MKCTPSTNRSQRRSANSRPREASVAFAAVSTELQQAVICNSYSGKKITAPIFPGFVRRQGGRPLTRGLGEGLTRIDRSWGEIWLNRCDDITVSGQMGCRRGKELRPGPTRARQKSIRHLALERVEILRTILRGFVSTCC